MILPKKAVQEMEPYDPPLEGRRDNTSIQITLHKQNILSAEIKKSTEFNQQIKRKKIYQIYLRWLYC